MGLFSKKNRSLSEIEFDIEDTNRELENTKVNHILHLLLSLVTGGIWLIVWFFVTNNAQGKRAKYRKKLKELYLEKESTTNSSSSNLASDKLKNLAELHEKGLLTDEEFAQHKEKLLKS